MKASIPPNLVLPFLLAVGAVPVGLSGCQEPTIEAGELVANMEPHIGKRVRVKGSFRPGLRCRLETADGEWKTYCGDCQVCKGPYVLDVNAKDTDPWPLVLAGTWKLRDIRCKGPLGQVECYPLKTGQPYIVEGILERSTPPKLFVDGFWRVEQP